MVETVSYYCTLVLLVSLGLSFYRVAKGPSVADRVLGSDGIILNLIGILIAYSIATRSAQYFDMVLVFSLLGFIGIVCFAKYLGRGKIIE